MYSTLVLRRRDAAADADDDDAHSNSIGAHKTKVERSLTSSFSSRNNKKETSSAKTGCVRFTNSSFVSVVLRLEVHRNVRLGRVSHGERILHIPLPGRVVEVHEKHLLRFTKRQRERGVGEDMADVHVRQRDWKIVQTMEMGRFRCFIRSFMHDHAIWRGRVSPNGWVARLAVSKLANEDLHVFVRFV